MTKESGFYALRFSFTLRYRNDVQYSVAIPLEKVAHLNFLADHVADDVMAVIRQDNNLLVELFGDFEPDDRELKADWDSFWKDLQRFNELLILVPTD